MICFDSLICHLRASQFSDESLDAANVLQPGRGFKAAVDVDSCQTGMMEVSNSRRTVLIDAAAQQERSIACISVEQRPVELIARTSVLRCLGVEKIILAQAFVGRYGRQIARRGYGKCLDEFHTCGLQVMAELGRLVAMQLDVVQAKAVSVHQDIVLALVDEYAYPPRPDRKVSGHFEKETGRAWVENESNEVYSQLFRLSDVFSVGHAAHFDDIVWMIHDVCVFKGC